MTANSEEIDQLLKEVEVLESSFQKRLMTPKMRQDVKDQIKSINEKIQKLREEAERKRLEDLLIF